MAHETNITFLKGSDEFDAQWFNTTIGPQYGGVVTKVTSEVIGEGIGFLGELHRCSLTWQGTTTLRVLS